MERIEKRIQLTNELKDAAYTLIIIIYYYLYIREGFLSVVEIQNLINDTIINRPKKLLGFLLAFCNAKRPFFYRLQSRHMKPIKTGSIR